VRNRLGEGWWEDHCRHVPPRHPRHGAARSDRTPATRPAKGLGNALGVLKMPRLLNYLCLNVGNPGVFVALWERSIRPRTTNADNPERPSASYRAVPLACLAPRGTRRYGLGRSRTLSGSIVFIVNGHRLRRHWAMPLGVGIVLERDYDGGVIARRGRLSQRRNEAPAER